MAFRLFIGGLPLDCRHDDLSSWIFGLWGAWPVTRQLVLRGNGATLQVGFVGFSDLASMQAALNGLQRFPFYGNRRTTVSISRDSKGHGKGSSPSLTQPAQGVASGVQAVVDTVEIATQTATTMVEFATQATPTMVEFATQATPTMVEVEIQTDISMPWNGPEVPPESPQEEVPTANVSPTEAAFSPTHSGVSRSRSPPSSHPTVLVGSDADEAETSRRLVEVKKELEQLKQEVEVDPKEEEQVKEESESDDATEDTTFSG